MFLKSYEPRISCIRLKLTFTAQKMKFSIKYFFSKCDQILCFLQIWSHLLKKSLIENFIFCAVYHTVCTLWIHKQPLKVFCKKRCSKKYQKIHRKTPVPNLYFNKVAGLMPLLKKRLWHRCFLVNFATFSRAPFLQNTSA